MSTLRSKHLMETFEEFLSFRCQIYLVLDDIQKSEKKVSIQNITPNENIVKEFKLLFSEIRVLNVDDYIGKREKTIWNRYRDTFIQLVNGSSILDTLNKIDIDQLESVYDKDSLRKTFATWKSLLDSYHFVRVFLGYRCDITEFIPELPFASGKVEKKNDFTVCAVSYYMYVVSMIVYNHRILEMFKPSEEALMIEILTFNGQYYAPRTSSLFSSSFNEEIEQLREKLEQIRSVY